MSLSIVQVQSGQLALCDSDGNVLGIVDDTGVKRLACEVLLKAGQTLAVSGPLTDTQLRATAVPVSAAALPLPVGAATETGNLATLAGKDFATQTTLALVKAKTDNIPSDPARESGKLTSLETILTAIKDTAGIKKITDMISANIAQWLGSTAPTVGQKVMAASIPVVLSSDQSAITVTMTPTTAATAGFTMGDIQTAVLGTYAIRRGTYNEPSSNAQRSIASTSANDAAAGTGARTVQITYYTATFTGPFTETITLNGTAAVNTVNSNICYIEKIVVLTAGSTGSNVGTLTLYVSTGGGGGVVATITATSNQTHFCHHYVPVNKTGHITAQWAGHDGTTVGSGGTFVIRAKPLNVANATDLQVSDTFRLYGQSSSVQRNYGTPIQVVGPARITTYVIPETSTSVNYRASFDFYED